MIHLTSISWIGFFALSFFVALYAAISGGGALVLVPVFNLIGIPLLPAIASVRVVSAFLQFIGVIAFNRKKKVDWAVSLWASVWVVPTSVLGATIAIHLPQRFLSFLVAALMIFALALVLKINVKNSTKQPRDRRFYFLVALGSIALGLYGGVYGAAFSTLLMIFFIRFGGEDVLTASANASVVGVVMATAASIVYIRNGIIDWPFILPLVLGGGAGTIVAVELAVKKEQSWIKKLLVVIILLSIIKLGFDVFRGR